MRGMPKQFYIGTRPIPQLPGDSPPDTPDTAKSDAPARPKMHRQASRMSLRDSFEGARPVLSRQASRMSLKEASEGARPVLSRQASRMSLKEASEGKRPVLNRQASRMSLRRTGDEFDKPVVPLDSLMANIATHSERVSFLRTQSFQNKLPSDLNSAGSSSWKASSAHTPLDVVEGSAESSSSSSSMDIPRETEADAGRVKSRITWESEISDDSHNNNNNQAEVNVGCLMDNDVGKALVNAQRSRLSTNSYDFQNFLQGLGFEVNEELAVREFTGKRLSVASHRRSSWNMLERSGSQNNLEEENPFERAKRDHERHLVQEIFGPPSQSYRVQPQHLALSRIMRHIFAVSEDMQSAQSSASENSLRAPSKLSMLPGRIATCFQTYVRKPAGYLVKKTLFQVFFMFLTVYALFGMDLFMALGNSDHEFAFLIINTVVFLLFGMELTLHSLGVRGYLFTMPFTLDALAVVSILSDTWFLQGDLFGEDTASVLRMARSSRVARLARLARIARFTRMLPVVATCSSRNRLQLAKMSVTRRLWRVFLFLDTERTGSISSFDLKCFYLVMLQNHPAMMGDAMRLGNLEEDTRWFNNHFPEEVAMDWDDFSHAFLATRMGKLLLRDHSIELDTSEGAWRLTRKIGDRTALKVSILILLLLGATSFFESDNRAEGMALGVIGLDYLARREHARGPLANLTDLCHQIDLFRQRYTPTFLYLDGYVRWEDGRCDQGNNTNTGPYEHIKRLIADAKMRSSDYMVTCVPEAEDCSKLAVTSIALIDNTAHSRKSAWMVLASTLLVIALLMVFIAIMNVKMNTFTKTLLSPLRALLDDMGVLSVLELANVDVDMPETDVKPKPIAMELRELHSSFKSLRGAIRSWSKYVPPAVVQRLFAAGLEAQIGVSRVTCTILFCDLIGFEEQCADLAPQEVLLVLATALGTISEVIDRYRGTLLEFIGDEVLAVFNAPNRVRHHVYAGVMTALDIHNAIGAFPRFVSKDGHEVSLLCRCGVHTGQILAGNIGSPQRMKYGLLGDSINLTARLKTLNSRYDTQTLISDMIHTDDYCMRRTGARPVDVVAVKGKKEPTVVYEAMHLDTQEVTQALELHKEAFKLYQERNFAEASAMFADVVEFFGEADGPSTILKSRCDRYAKEPPPADWDGVERLTAKSFQPG